MTYATPGYSNKATSPKNTAARNPQTATVHTPTSSTKEVILITETKVMVAISDIKHPTPATIFTSMGFIQAGVYLVSPKVLGGSLELSIGVSRLLLAIPKT